MKVPRSTMVTAGLAAAAALTATGITYASAASAPVPQSAPAVAAAAPLDGMSGQGKGNEGRGGRGGPGGPRGDWGRIEINERSYSAHPGDCITVVSGLGARTLNIRNDTHKTVEVFRGAVCDNGAPIATVGPHSSANGVRPCPTHGVHVRDGVLASFRVVRHYGGDWG
ncbi:hypothetical protein [Streptomyces sp. NPDC004546]|uniref:hypothetical protein n=1 Tax=Streptomyces sp. NPDC004546 TaxID=3154282 RepID=UPI0033B31477